MKEILHNIEKEFDVAKSHIIELLEPQEGLLQPHLSEILYQSFQLAAKTSKNHISNGERVRI
jgi:hypothetical protein